MSLSSGRIFFHHTTGSLGTRKREFGPKDFPFVHKNRADLEAALAKPCCFCGYAGTAPRTLFMETDTKSPAQLVQSSRAGFLRAMQEAKVACPNCACEKRGPTRRAKRLSKHPVSVVNNNPSVVLEAIRVPDQPQTELSSEVHLASAFSEAMRPTPRGPEPKSL